MTKGLHKLLQKEQGMKQGIQVSDPYPTWACLFSLQSQKGNLEEMRCRECSKKRTAPIYATVKQTTDLQHEQRNKKSSESNGTKS